MLWPPMRSWSAETVAEMRLAPAPTLMTWLQSLPSPAMRMVTAEAANRRSVVSAICSKERLASPGAAAMARRISADAILRSRATRSSCFRRAISACAEGTGGFLLLAGALRRRDLVAAGLFDTDLLETDWAAAALRARFAGFFAMRFCVFRPRTA